MGLRLELVEVGGFRMSPCARARPNLVRPSRSSVGMTGAPRASGEPRRQKLVDDKSLVKRAIATLLLGAEVNGCLHRPSTGEIRSSPP
jgi:hypothetical protein